MLDKLFPRSDHFSIKAIDGNNKLVIVEDKELLETAKIISDQLLQDDPDLSSAENLLLKNYLLSKKGKTVWSKVA